MKECSTLGYQYNEIGFVLFEVNHTCFTKTPNLKSFSKSMKDKYNKI